MGLRKKAPFLADTFSFYNDTIGYPFIGGANGHGLMDGCSSFYCELGPDYNGGVIGPPYRI